MRARVGARIPEGFAMSLPRGPFAEINGPVYRKPSNDNAPARFGFLPEERHCNGLGFIHGGMISTFLDGAMAQAVQERAGCPLVTLALQVRFQSPSPKQRWTEAEITLEPANGDNVTAHAEMRARGVVCATATGAYRLLPHRRKAG